MHRFKHDFFFFNDTATTEIYTLSLHDALPISAAVRSFSSKNGAHCPLFEFPERCWITLFPKLANGLRLERSSRSEEHTSELQSRLHLVCRLLLEKKTTGKMTLSHRLHHYVPGD